MTPLILKIATEVASAGGRALLVGGCVRDQLLGLKPKDYDIEAFGVPEVEMEPLLARCGQVSRVGRAFPVWKVWTTDQGQAIDVTLPRKETKRGPGHTDFEITLDPTMTFEEASSRRDYRLNAMGRDPLTNELLDPHNGQEDLDYGILRHVSHHFAEDPLRVLRGAQFIARFGLTAHPDTIDLCRTLTPEHLSAERLWEEWSKLILKGVHIGRGLRFLKETGWLAHFPELAALVGVEQDPVHHPEIWVFDHVCHCMDAFAARRTGDADEDMVVGFAVLAHDLGKASTTTRDDRGIHSYGHEEAGEAPTRAFLNRLTNQTDFINDVVALVVNHMIPTHLYKEATRGETIKQMNCSIRRLARKVNLTRLAAVVLADKSGRPPKPKVSPESEWLLSRAASLSVTKEGPVPLLLGRHLIDLGLKPSVAFKTILTGAFERQVDGDITTLEEAIAYAKLIAGLRPRVSLLDDVHHYIATATPEQVQADLKAADFDGYNQIGADITPPTP